MMPPLSPNTKAILLLTAPLIVGRGTPTVELLTPGAYKMFAQRLRELGRQPADLIGPDAAALIEDSRPFVEPRRLEQLLARGLQLGQAADRWKQRAIWVVSRADVEYPRRLKAKLGSQAPSVLYGCGDVGALDDGGLAVVGSRSAGEELEKYAMEVGSLAARAKRPIISGGAEGIDLAAMRGALEADGRVFGVLAHSLERQVMTREHRDMLLEGQLVLASPYDPSAGFNKGFAMQRNKIVYALSDAALVVSSDFEKGGTWTGAMEQLTKLKLVRVYVRSAGAPQRGLDALRNQGAIPWPNPATPADLHALLDEHQEQPAELPLPLKLQVNAPSAADVQPSMPAENVAPNSAADGALSENKASVTEPAPADNPSERLFDTVRSIIVELAHQPIVDGDLADALSVPKPLARAWLDRLVHDGVLKKRKKPAVYVMSQPKLI